MTLKSDLKFEEKPKVWFQKRTEEFREFNASRSKYKNLHFDVLFCQYHIKFQLK